MQQSQLNELFRSIESIKMSGSISLACREYQVRLFNRNSPLVSHQGIEYEALSLGIDIDYNTFVFSSSSRYTVLLSQCQQTNSSEVSWHVVPFEMVRPLVDLGLKWLSANSLWGEKLLWVGLPNHGVVFRQVENGWEVDTENCSYVEVFKVVEEKQDEAVSYLGKSVFGKLGIDDDAVVEAAAKQL